MEYDKDIKCGLYEASIIVSETPCWLFSVIVISNQTTAKLLTLRNGRDGNAERVMELYASVYDSAICIFEEPIFLANGLYLEFGTDITAAMVQYKQEY